MIIRKATYADLPDILRIYENARTYMSASGNPHQWGNTYPPLSLVEDDIERRRCHICMEDDQIIGVFCFFKGKEPTYETIYDGAWIDDAPYGVIHRVAVAEHGKGVASQCFAYAIQKCGNVRIDTHRDNIPMQKALLKNGFTYCGIIHLENGDERLAYQKQDKSKMPVELAPRIMYEDDCMIVVEKPVGMPSQPDHTKQRSVLDYLQGIYPYVGLVHRLDTPTGGVMIFSKNPKYTNTLSMMISDKDRTEKYYLAILPSSPEKPQDEYIDYLYHDTRTNKSFVVDSRRGASQLAHLSYEVLSTAQDMTTLVKVRIFTGRSHQIRVQFAHRKLPLLGDGKYGSRYKMKPQGFALWSHGLKLVHPQTRQTMTFVSLPPLDAMPWNLFQDIKDSIS